MFQTTIKLVLTCVSDNNKTGVDMFQTTIKLVLTCVSDSNKTGADMRFECDFPLFRIQTLTQSHPRIFFFKTPQLSSSSETLKWLRSLPILTQNCSVGESLLMQTCSVGLSIAFRTASFTHLCPTPPHQHHSLAPTPTLPCPGS